jgi:hypothetical protein
MVRLKDGVISGVSLSEAAVTRRVDVDGEMVRVARAVGVEFG